MYGTVPSGLCSGNQHVLVPCYKGGVSGPCCARRSFRESGMAGQGCCGARPTRMTGRRSAHGACADGPQLLYRAVARAHRTFVRDRE